MSVPPTRGSAFENAPMDDLLDILLRQFKRPLAGVGVELTPTLTERIAKAAAAQQPLPPEAEAIRAGLVEVVQASEQVLAAWDKTFQQSLQTEMGAIPGWETTAEFLEVANEKSNAELRIAAGSAMLLALGDAHFADYLLFLVEHPHLDDVSAVMARRVLAFASETQAEVHDPDWLAKVKAWLAAQE